MGICMDTEANAAKALAESEALAEEQAMQEWKGGGRAGSQIITRSPKSGNQPMANIGKVKFQPPNVPVIFVLGGPGSGKVTHCDTLMQEKRGVTHINMMDLLQQYAIGNDMSDFSQLPSKTVTEVLMLEMKMSPAAKTYLISGYPRSMRDVVEYSEKIQVINGVVLISWRQAVLQRQIDYGAKLGHVVLSLAKMELENFFKSVMPVADYFDQSDMLVAINGERAPSEVYKDFRSSVLDILQTQENQEAVLNGVAGIGHGIDDIPGSIVSVETAPSQSKSKDYVAVTSPPNVVDSPVIARTKMNGHVGQKIIEVETINQTNLPMQPTQGNLSKMPKVIFVIGGPGSNKATLCLKAVGINPGWGHLSIGKTLRNLAESEPKPKTENFAIKDAITNGEMVTKASLDKLIHSNILQLMNKRGIIIDGFPRDMVQIEEFQDKYNQSPPIVLLDCSKLQLGRGRLDDSVSSFRRRLELFRELTLPMLKTLDSDGRLTIIDGDTDSGSVQREFERVIRQHIENLGGNDVQINGGDDRGNYGALFSNQSGSGGQNRRGRTEELIQDLEDSMPGAIPTISNQVSNHVALSNGTAAKHMQQRAPGANGHVPNGRPNFRTMLEDAEMDSHI